MKTKQQKREEALTRLQASIARTETEIARYENRAKEWVSPVLKASSTPQDRFLFALQSKENPFLSMVESSKRHLERMEADKFRLMSLIARNRTSYV
jgi:beta-lactamase class D